MPNAAPRDRSWFAPALGIVAAITGLRILLLAFAQADLFVDEAQYWLWGQDLAFGYYSKPPLIAWVIRAATELAGSDAPFWVRLPAPLFHAATALILGGIAARLHSAPAGIVTAAAYATLPMVAVGSLLISTDTIMFPFLAGTLALYLSLLAPGGAGRPYLAVLAGISLGLAFLAKYAALYYLGLGALAALSPRLRPDGRDALALLAGFVLIAAPNVVWNAMHGLTTVSHTLDNTGWERGLSLHPAEALVFLRDQFAVAGPVILLALLMAGLVRRADALADDPAEMLLKALALPIVALVTVQALISGANANWAAAAYLSGTVLAVLWLLPRSRFWLIVSFTLNGALCLAVPLAVTQAAHLRLGGRLVLARYVGLDAFSQQILALARDQGATAIVAAERSVLANLLYTGRNEAIAVFAAPFEGAPHNHYEQSYPYPRPDQRPDPSGPVLAVFRDPAGPPCTPLKSVTLTPGPGAYERHSYTAALVPADCWGAP